jgi:hypothetical protein
MRVGRLVLLAVLAVSWSPAAAEEISGPVYAKQGRSQVEVTEAARWKAYAAELKRDRDDKDTQIADLKALLEKSMGDLEAAQRDRDEWRRKAEAVPRGGRNP